MRRGWSGESAGYALALLCAAASPSLGRYAAVPFAVLAVGSAATGKALSDRSGVGRDVAVFALAAAALATLVVLGGHPVYLVTAPVAFVVAGHVGSRARWRADAGAGGVYLLVGGSAAAVAAALGPAAGGLAAGVGTGAVAGAALRSVMAEDRPTVLLAAAAAGTSVGAAFGGPPAVGVVIALLVTVVLGGFAYRAGAMTASGAFGGVLLAFVTIVAAGYRWFVLLGLFVVMGAAWTRYREEEKIALDVVDVGEDRRGFSNVMANGVVALAAAVAFGLSPDAVATSTAALAFGGSIATATGDTLSSEIGSVHGEPRLITTMEHVPPGTDGGVSAVGEAVTVVGAVGIGVAATVLGVVGPGGMLAIAVGGVVGAHVDSLLGATLESRFLGNDAVNLAACAAGAAAAAGVGPHDVL